MTAERSISDRIALAREGNREAFDSLIESCGSSLEAYARRRLGTFLRGRVDPEDVLQEVYGRAWKSMRGFRGADDGELVRWLRGIASHVLIDLASRHRRDQIIFVEELGDAAHPQPSPSRVLRRGERLVRFQDALDDLSPDHREVLTLVRLRGLKIREAAVHMNRTPNAVMKLLTRALKALKDSFGDTESCHLPSRPSGGEGLDHDR